MSRLLQELADFFQRNAGLAGRGIVAVSGGADSVALLRALLQVREPQSLIVAHFHHHLRGTASDDDAAFVEQLAASWGVPFAIGHADVAAETARLRGNIEATARKLRYDWLRRIAEQTNAAWIATGHTADDQAETLLHRLIRGTGLQGLRGIAANRPLIESRGEESASRVRLIRPLLTVTRADVVAFLQEQGVTHIEDASNCDPAFTRNRIRTEVLPLLKTFNPEVVAALTRLAEQVDEVFAEQQEAAMQLLQQAEKPRAGSIVILDCATLVGVRDAVIRGMFSLIWTREGWPTRDMDRAAWNRTAAIVNCESHASHFPGNISIHRSGTVLRVGEQTPRPRRTDAIPPDPPHDPS